MSAQSSDGARSFRFHPHAAAELTEEAHFLSDDDLEVAGRFEAAVDHAIDQLLRHPEIGRVIRESRGRKIRKWLVQGFRFNIVYAYLDDILRILAVAHHSRKPGYWVYRLRSMP